ncbi:glycosyltransferase family 2 protein [Aeromonas media]|uniref:glycosyltransferase family 2 protein n=1 Tax=Aeromonas media TaxID=651 RepID=UPI0038CF50D5
MSPNYIPKVSVIVPVYNTELYVERAIISLMEQTLDDVQFIIIDDGSKDNSLNIIKQVITRYPARQGQVTLISRENRGVAATRAQGMELATGDYVIHLDSDDWAELNWLEALYTKAIEDKADVVVCDYSMIFKVSAQLVRQETKSSGVECIGQLLAGELHGSTWNKLVRRAVISNFHINFNDDICYLEDYIYIMQIFYYSHGVSYIDKPLLNYNCANTSSITSCMTEQKFHSIVNAISFIEKFLAEHELAALFQAEVLMLKMSHSASTTFKFGYRCPERFIYYYKFNIKDVHSSNQPLHNKLLLLSSYIRFTPLTRLIIFMFGMAKIIQKLIR